MTKRRKKRKPYNLKRFKASLSTGLRELERIVLQSDDDDQVIRACNSLATLANSFRNLEEVTDIIERIEILEKRIES